MLKVNLHPSIDRIHRDHWNALCGTAYPFLRHEFLHALEASGSACADTGWHPCHLEISEDGETRLLMPLYLKSHSWGEYVFDWAWAEAHERQGLPYYPRLLTAIPFTPATGPRYGSHLGAAESLQLISDLIPSLCDQVQASSWHGLFVRAEDARALPAPLLLRTGCQYHWFNRGYTSFDHFLDRFNSRKRKAVRRERKKVREQGVRLERRVGTGISTEMLDRFYHFYQMTYLKRGRQGYLTPDFFHRLHQNMAEQLLLVLAWKDDTPVAGALSLIGDDCLYGRYWGCLEEYDSLHFEACYYQGIEFCIEQGLARFDPGAQGEHKIQRGFEPVPTWSAHWIAHPDFRRAISAFLDQETPAVQARMRALAELLPFKQPGSSPD